MVQHLSQKRFYKDRFFASLSAREARPGATVLVAGDQKSMLRPMLHALALGSLVAIGANILAPTPAKALSMQECSAKYKAAQAAGTLGSVKWNDFRKAQCGDGTAAAPAGVPATAAPATAAPATGAPATRQGSVPAVPARTGQQAGPQANPGRQAAPAQQAAPAAVGAAAFPRGISAKYQSETPAKQRMHTCLDQYNANKVSNANGGLKWIQKGGGYYSECNKRLKG